MVLDIVCHLLNHTTTDDISETSKALRKTPTKILIYDRTIQTLLIHTPAKGCLIDGDFLGDMVLIHIVYFDINARILSQYIVLIIMIIWNIVPCFPPHFEGWAVYGTILIGI